uniref:Uncharacterized protein n=1 Tax=Aegilops tauschii subsp. strangulata TaxID=200361 RepID=A0A453IPF7_AEGTS
RLRRYTSTPSRSTSAPPRPVAKTSAASSPPTPTTRSPSNSQPVRPRTGAAAAGSDDFGGLFSADTADQLALEFPTCNHFDGFQKATMEMVSNKKGTNTLSFIFDKASSSPPSPGPAWAGTHLQIQHVS